MDSPINSEKNFTVAENYRKIRLFKGKSQEEVVKELKLALPGNDSIKQNVSTWETLKGNPGKTFIGHLSKILDVPLEVFYMKSLTEEYLKNEFPDENHAPMPKTGDNKQNGEFRESVYKTIVEGHTEYMLVPRSMLNETQLVSTEQIKRTWEELAQKNNELAEKNKELENKNKQIDFYQGQFAKLMENLELTPKPPDSKEVKNKG